MLKPSMPTRVFSFCLAGGCPDNSDDQERGSYGCCWGCQLRQLTEAQAQG